ncbi:unnamed protein product [Phytophthora fragariaefolia]|uniref:Unnamed protein product n=1 Tax=Phytophthora fragariaefolia TaxID=1490495 RepID=A0A9W6XGJ2_9STRA|nr:unnamed protein product [Phytophthora fragariaefolia]
MDVVIPNVTLADGTTTADPDLMTPDHTKFWGVLLEHTTTQLSAEDKQFLDAPITTKDFYWAIQTTAKEKLGGLGIPAEYSTQADVSI